MRAHAKVWLISAALGVFSCSQGGSDQPDKPARRITDGGGDNSYGDDPYPYGGSRNVGSGGQSGKGGAPPSLGGSAGHSAGSASNAGASGTGVSAAIPGAGNSATSGSAGVNSEATADCPSVTRVRLKNGDCIDRFQEFPLANSPTSIVTGSDGRVWFDDAGRNQLVQLDHEGGVVQRRPCVEGSSPRAMVAGRDEQALIWYTDAGPKTLNRVTQTERLTINLNFTATAIALGKEDIIWATEAGQALYQVRWFVAITPYPAVVPNNVLVFGPDQNVWFPAGAAMAQLNPGQPAEQHSMGDSRAEDLTVGPDGALWFTDWTNHGIGRMDLAGKLQTYELPVESGPSRIVMGPDGALWFTESNSDQIGRISVNGVITHYPIPTSGGSPYALTVGGDGNIWFTERLSGKIGRLRTDPRD